MEQEEAIECGELSIGQLTRREHLLDASHAEKPLSCFAHARRPPPGRDGAPPLPPAATLCCAFDGLRELRVVEGASGAIVASRRVHLDRLLRALALLSQRSLVSLAVAALEEEEAAGGGGAHALVAMLRVSLAPPFFCLQPEDDLAPHSAQLLEALAAAAVVQEERAEEDSACAAEELGAAATAAAGQEEGQGVRDRVFDMALPHDWRREEPDPPGLLCSCFRYQRRMLAWGLWRESLGGGCGAPLALDPEAGAAPDPDSAKGRLPARDVLWQPMRLPCGRTVYVGGGVARLAPVGPPLPEPAGGVLADEMGLGEEGGSWRTRWGWVGVGSWRTRC